MTATNKRLLISESHGDSNRCTPCRGKPDQHSTYASHTGRRTPNVRFLRVTPVRQAHASCGRSLYVTTFHWLPRSRNKPLYPKEVLATKDTLIQPSSWVTSFLLSCDSPGVGERGFSPMVTQLHQLTGRISLACDQYVQHLFTGANRTVHNRHRRGIQP
jgi:hypothetical protein